MHNLISIRNQAGEIRDLNKEFESAIRELNSCLKKVIVVDTQGVDAQGLHIYI